MTLFEVLSETRAREIVDATRRAIRAQLAGDKRSEDARAMVLTSETYQLRAAAKRRLRSVTDDMSADEYRRYFREKRERLRRAMERRR